MPAPPPERLYQILPPGTARYASPGGSPLAAGEVESALSALPRVTGGRSRQLTADTPNANARHSGR
ncbi:MAG TPA: hypothetical protein VH879_02070 [Gemmatimonadales bacterium]